TTTTIQGSLSKDGKTLTLTAGTTEYFDGTYAITVSDKVKDVDGKAIKPYAGTFSIKDEVAPEVKEAKFDVASAKFELKFTEPVKVKTDANDFVVRVNGQPATGVAFANNVLSFTKPAGVKAGDTVSIYVSGAD